MFNKEYNYLIKDSTYIKDNYSKIVDITKISIEKTKKHLNFQGFDSSQKNNITWGYNLYNTFSVNSCSKEYIEIYKFLRESLQEYFFCLDITLQQCWIQSWINSHKFNDTLESHNHNWMFHGYISIDSKNTSTVFTDSENQFLYKIINKPGQIYIGPGNRYHYVKVNEPFENERLTLGFDVVIQDMYVPNLSFIPIFL